jgi:hypothetical protein
MTMSNIKSILLARQPLDKVDVPEFGKPVFFRRMNGHDRDRFMASITEETSVKQVIELQNLILSLTLCDEKGVLVFDSSDEVGQMDGIIRDKLALAAMGLNGFTKESAAAIEKKL